MPTIYVVEDEPLLLDLICSVLHVDGRTIIAKADPVSAFEVIMASKEPIDLLITDAYLQPISGFELVKRLRAQRVDCPVIFISGYPGCEAMAAAFVGTMVVEKPFTAKELRAAVEKMMSCT